MVIMGAGGGLGHMAIQYAKVMGMRVIAIDGGAEKEKLCLSLGAEHFIDYTSIGDIGAEVVRITTYGAHAVAVFATAKQSYATAPFLLRPGGIVVAVGIPADGRRFSRLDSASKVEHRGRCDGDPEGCR